MIVNFAITAVLLLCVGQMVVMANDFNGIKYKLEKVNNVQVELSLMRSKCIPLQSEPISYLYPFPACRH